MYKKIILKICLIFTIVAFLQGCAMIKSRLAIRDCKFQIANVGELQYDPFRASDKLGITLNIDCYNPNKTIEAVLDKLAFNLFVNDKKTVGGTVENKLKIPPEKTIQFPINVQLSLSDIEKTVFEVVKSGNANYELKGNAYFSTPIGESSIPVTISKGKWSGD